MPSNEEIKIVINADDKASGVLADVSKSAGGLSGVLKGVAGVAGVAVVAGFAAMTAEAFRAVGAFSEAQISSEKLEHAVIGVSHGTRQQIDDIKELTAALQRKGVVDADALNSGVAQLSTFGLSTKMVKDLIPALADLTINQAGVNATTQDYESSANVMAKALNGQFGVLEKSGIRFTDAQQKLIQFGSESERTAALIEGFNQNLKFTNEGAMNTFQGKLANLKNALGEFEETIGGVLVNALTPFVAKLSEFASSDAAQAAITAISNAIEGLMVVFGNAITFDVQFLKSIYELAQGLLEQLKPAFDIIMIVIQTEIVPAFTQMWDVIKNQLWPSIMELWASLQPFVPLLTQFAKVMGVVVVAAILLAVKALIDITTWVAKVLTAITEVSTVIVNIGVGAWNKLQQILVAVIESLRSIISFAQTAANAVSSVGGKVGNALLPGSPFGGGRAVGGPVSAGTSYLVGERGAEIFTPSQSGRIIPNAGGAGIVINITGTFLSSDAAMAMADMFADRLKLELKI